MTAVFDHLGSPNLVGFLFGEPLFSTEGLEQEDAEASTPPA